MKRLEGKKAIVTGAAQGLGAAILERLAEEGCDVAAWDIHLEQVLSTTAAVDRKTSRRVKGLQVDVTDAAAVRGAAAVADAAAAVAASAGSPR